MIQTKRRSAVIAAFAMLMFVFGAVAVAKVKKHNHNSGHAKVASKLKTDGTHQIDKKGKHTIHAEVKKGKIASFHVKHETKGEVAVKKYKSKKKMASLENPRGDGAQPADAFPADTDVGTVWIAYAYEDDDGNEEYYWFPYEEILDGDTGAIEYVPLS
jgi:hypothetical protein